MECPNAPCSGTTRQMQKLHGASPTKSQAVNVSPNRFSTGPSWNRALNGQRPSIPNAENWSDGKLPSQTDCLKLQYLPNSFTVGVFRRNRDPSVPPPVTEWALVPSRQDSPRGFRLPRIGPRPVAPAPVPISRSPAASQDRAPVALVSELRAPQCSGGATSRHRCKYMGLTHIRAHQRSPRRVYSSAPIRPTRGDVIGRRTERIQRPPVPDPHFESNARFLDRISELVPSL
jgi:hypothetical protein